jgi:hypothetical protein
MLAPIASSPLSFTWMEESRLLFQGRQQAGLRLLGSGLVPLSQVCPSEVVHPDLVPHYERLWEHGRLVWGAVIRVHPGALEVGKDAPITLMLYSTEIFFDARIDALQEVAYHLRSLPIRALHEETTLPAGVTPQIERNAPLFHYQVPPALSEGIVPAKEASTLFLGSARLHRSRLPLPLLTGLWFPLIIAPELTSSVMVLPQSYWSPALIERWKNPAPTLQPMFLRYQLQPFVLAPQAAALLKNAITSQGLSLADTYLQPSRDQSLELTTTPRPDSVHTLSEQIKIAMPHEMLAYYVGTLLTTNSQGHLSLRRAGV